MYLQKNVVLDYSFCKRLIHQDDPEHLQKNVVSDNPLCKRLAHTDDPKHLQKKCRFRLSSLQGTGPSGRSKVFAKKHNNTTTRISKNITTIILTGRNITASSKPTRTPHPIELSSPCVHVNHQHDHIRDRSI